MHRISHSVQIQVSLFQFQHQQELFPHPLQSCLLKLSLPLQIPTPVPNRLDFFTDTLEMLDARIDSLTVTLDFANRIFSKKLYSIYNLKTAKTIDKTAAEYDLTLNAESAFKISAVNTEHVYYFPLWDFCKMPLEENGLTMSDADFLQQKTKDIIFSKASSKHTLQDGISLMKKDLDKLMQWRNTILLELSDYSPSVLFTIYRRKYAPACRYGTYRQSRSRCFRNPA